ncbi:MAG: hypothetical protein K2J87_05765 [Muribaculaceae bacterium]|nr:hypothetical protein [Muribaculaceae bacterium]
MYKIKYSIIYAVIRPQIKERISVGLIIIDDSSIDIRYSDKKLAALKYLYTESELNFVTEVVRSIDKDGTIKNISDIEYLSRYSNNLISFSSIETIDLEATKENKEWLFHSYVGEN